MMRRHLRLNAALRRCRSESGAELVEFALVLPLLLVLIGGIADFAMLFQNYEVTTNAAREGARLAVLPGSEANNYAVVTARVNDSGTFADTITYQTAAQMRTHIAAVAGP